MLYRIFKALHEETDKGWVWLSSPKTNTRRIIWIYNPAKRRCVYCEYRYIDDNFVSIYNKKKHTRNINPELRDRALVISKWYRDALKLKDDEDTDVELSVNSSKLWGWGILRAGCQHPEAIVRVATGLGVISCWLGITSVLFASIGANWPAAIISVLLGLLILKACHSPRGGGL